MRNIVIVDIDGTIAKVGDRLKYLQQEKKDWDAFYEHCDEDKPIREVIAVVETLANSGFKLVFCTGRRKSVRKKTREWIHRHMVLHNPSYKLLMRKDEDHRHDTDVKPELLAKARYTPDRVLCIFEDRDSMVKKWRELGFTCLQVNDGDF